jgi:hypothetical protein
MESIQLLNTAIIKSKEKKIDNSYEERLKEISKSPALVALNKAISSLAEAEKISKDQASIQIVETIRELDNIWSDYVTMEGIDRLKGLLKDSHH